MLARLRPFVVALAVGLPAPVALVAQVQTPEPPDVGPDGVIDLTFEGMVDYALSTSYRMRFLNLDIEQTQLNLRASRARLRSRVDLDFTVPTINYISESRWDPSLQRNVIQREDSRQVEAELSIRQPVILFGFPTNGYLSLNNRMYRLTQQETDDRDIRYYNRYFVSYTQPLFQANELKNDLEEAELDLESQELDFYSDVVDIIDNTADDYFELFEIAYERRINQAYVARLEQALAAARDAAAQNPDRAIDADQVQVELANAREEVAATDSRYRLETSRLKTRYGIDQGVEIRIDPVVELTPVPVDVEQATRYALELTPRMRELDISRREAEIDLDNRKGRGGFELNVQLSYGREMQDERFGDIWGEPENSYEVDVEGSLPIWDWGERKARIEAQEINLRRAALRIEETTREITTNIQNEVRNVEEYETRALNLQQNLELARGISDQSLERYAAGTISALDLLQSVRRELDTAENFLDAYIGWRESLQRIQEQTYYDFERDTFILDRFGIEFGTMR
ncbi:MAG: TolC family protein [Longimicrobiales bacterium]